MTPREYMMKNKNKTIVIGITGGIAGYKISGLIKLLKQKDYHVEVVMTETAVKMFGTEIFQKETGKPVFYQLLGKDFDYREIVERREVDHIKLADSADLLLIAPSTANTIAKLAAGFADNFLTTLSLAVACPIVICPSMNVHMWENPQTRENLDKLQKRGVIVIPPDSGDLACGYTGVGRLRDIKEIAGILENLLKKSKQLSGRKILVTAGATMEAIDSVRYITNRGSGKMGLAIAREAKRQGAEVLLLRSQKAVSDPSIPEKTFSTAADLKKLLEEHTPVYDIIFHSAAVSDYIPEKKYKGKIESKRSLDLKLIQTAKLIGRIKKINQGIKLIGFKAVFGKNREEMKKIAGDLFRSSRADFIAVNDVSRKDSGFEADDNEIFLVTKKGTVVKLEKAAKDKIAAQLLEMTV
ncbi:MAG: CoaBC protein [Candidatus Gottesmanbacteria bacterium GW2011_GWA2_42_18]|uniref:Coenzyme A biosynthesis bifunctional protein CoaBC n=2 Tax=Candidatus Gottesmaniibacteriota TaxID=1752720 RepID=A0A0G1C6E4_9BACT|nr:MAG: CoaBC protein [Candidatus Gottesmanbacteria bacterium GW2011_GWA2_42_18]